MARALTFVTCFVGLGLGIACKDVESSKGAGEVAGPSEAAVEPPTPCAVQTGGVGEQAVPIFFELVDGQLVGVTLQQGPAIEREIQFERDSAGRIITKRSTIRGPEDHVLDQQMSYEYDQGARLVRVTHPDYISDLVYESPSSRRPLRQEVSVAGAVVETLRFEYGESSPAWSRPLILPLDMSFGAERTYSEVAGEVRLFRSSRYDPNTGALLASEVYPRPEEPGVATTFLYGDECAEYQSQSGAPPSSEQAPR